MWWGIIFDHAGILYEDCDYYICNKCGKKYTIENGSGDICEI